MGGQAGRSGPPDSRAKGDATRDFDAERSSQKDRTAYFDFVTGAEAAWRLYASIGCTGLKTSAKYVPASLAAAPS